MMAVPRLRFSFARAFGRCTAPLAVAASLLLGLVALAGTAAADDPISQVLQGGGAEWSDGFDVASTGAADVRTSTPILSGAIIAASAQAITLYSDIVARGGWPLVPADKKLKIGVSDPAVALLRQRLTVSGDIAPAPGISDSFDSYVDAGVRRFQARHGIPPDGVVGDSTFAAMNIPAAVRLNQLATNLTRLKMVTARATSPRFVMVNIPAASVEAVENGAVVSRHAAVVGKIDRPSPIVNSKITEINFHPFWTVPASIIRRDLIPIMQKDPGYLAKYHIRIYNPKGDELTPEQVDWTTDEATKYMFRQDPGDENSLGIVKINFASPEGVYMHDTPHKGLFNDEFRFDSSGCVRIQNVRELIVWLLRDTPGWSRDQIDAVFQSGERQDVKVAAPVALFWTYITAWSNPDGVVNFRNDIYSLDGLDQLALQQDAVDPNAPAPAAPQGVAAVPAAK
jgi:murein L,D-transpeptidase YcbB/YkuD